MLTIHFRLLLTATLFAPMLLLFCIYEFIYKCSKNTIDKNTFIVMFVFLGVSISLILFCYIIMRRATKQAPPRLLKVKSFGRRDQGILSFIFTFLFPLIRIPGLPSIAQYAICFIVFATVTIVISDIGGYQYNVVMRILRYKFYVVKDNDNIDCLLITKKPLRFPNIEAEVKQLHDDVYIAINN